MIPKAAGLVLWNGAAVFSYAFIALWTLLRYQPEWALMVFLVACTHAVSFRVALALWRDMMTDGEETEAV